MLCMTTMPLVVRATSRNEALYYMFMVLCCRYQLEHILYYMNYYMLLYCIILDQGRFAEDRREVLTFHHLNV